MIKKFVFPTKTITCSLIYDNRFIQALKVPVFDFIFLQVDPPKDPQRIPSILYTL